MPCCTISTILIRRQQQQQQLLLLLLPGLLHSLTYQQPSVRRRCSASLEQSTACSSFALDIAQFLQQQKTDEIIPVWTIFLFVTTCILTTLALL